LRCEHAVELCQKCLRIAWETVQRLFHPAEVSGTVAVAVAVIGIAVNGVSARLLMGQKGGLNVRGAFLHLVGDRRCLPAWCLPEL
jgi:Co/Zn/Cd efflux system component